MFEGILLAVYSAFMLTTFGLQSADELSRYERARLDAILNERVLVCPTEIPERPPGPVIEPHPCAWVRPPLPYEHDDGPTS